MSKPKSSQRKQAYTSKPAAPKAPSDDSLLEQGAPSAEELKLSAGSAVDEEAGADIAVEEETEATAKETPETDTELGDDEAELQDDTGESDDEETEAGGDSTVDEESEGEEETEAGGEATADGESEAEEETETGGEAATDGESEAEEEAETGGDTAADEESESEEETAGDTTADDESEEETATVADVAADDESDDDAEESDEAVKSDEVLANGDAPAGEKAATMENQTPLEEMAPAPTPAAAPVETSLIDESIADVPHPRSIVPDYSVEKMRKTYREIVRYEQEIGDLASKLNKRDAEIEKLKGEIVEIRDEMTAQVNQASFQTTKQMINVVLQTISMSNIRFQTLTDLMLTLALKDQSAIDITPEALQAAIKDTRTYSEVITGLTTGTKKESIVPVDVLIDANEPPTVLGMSLTFDTFETAAGLHPVIVAKETAENSLHGVKFPLPGILAHEFRAVSFAVKRSKTSFLRIRVRFCDSPETRADITVNLSNGVYAGYFNSNPLALHSVSIQRLKDEWIQIAFRTSLVGEGVPIELYVLGVPAIDAKVNRYDGDVAKGFAIRGLRIQKFNGYIDESTDTSADDATKVEETQPQKITVEMKMPGQELKRLDLRRAYLNSGEYGRLAGFRGIHAGRRAFILGNGPSLKSQDLTLLRNEITFATNWFVNHPQMNAIDPKYYCVSSHEMFGGWANPEPAVNKDWYKRMIVDGKRTTKFFSHRFSKYINSSALFDRNSVYYLLFDRPKYQIDQKGDINLDLSQPMDDGYTGIITFCLPLAHFMGIKEIYLLGCDCDYGITTPDSPKQYFYDFKMHTTATTSYEGLQRAWADDGPVFRTYETVRRRFALDGVSIINCTDGGRLEVFPRERYEEVIARPQS